MATMTVGGASGAWIRICVLLLLGEQPAHGYDLLQSLERFGATFVDTGTLYRVLRRTERDGLTQSEWEAGASGPARRIYGLTTSGWSVLDVVTADLEDCRDLVDLFLARANELSTTVS